MAPTENSLGRLVGKINWRINEVDGEFISRSTVQSFVQAQPGLLLNHGNDYLNYQDDWYATAKANVPYDKYWKVTDNSCAAEGDPAKLRTIYAEKLLEQAEMGFEEQLTLLARTTVSKIDKEEKVIMDAARRLEKKTEDGAGRLTETDE
eukprot:g16359.t1